MFSELYLCDREHRFWAVRMMPARLPIFSLLKLHVSAMDIIWTLYHNCIMIIILKEQQVQYKTFDILSDDEVKQGIRLR